MGRISFCQGFREHFLPCTMQSAYKITPNQKIDSNRHKQKEIQPILTDGSCKIVAINSLHAFLCYIFLAHLYLLNPLTFSVSESSISFLWDIIGTCSQHPQVLMPLSTCAQGYLVIVGTRSLLLFHLSYQIKLIYIMQQRQMQSKFSGFVLVFFYHYYFPKSLSNFPFNLQTMNLVVLDS